MQQTEMAGRPQAQRFPTGIHKTPVDREVGKGKSCRGNLDIAGSVTEQAATHLPAPS